MGAEEAADAMTRIAYVAAGAAAVAAAVFFGLELTGGSHLTSLLGAALVFWVALFAVHPAIGLLTLIVVRPLVDVYVHHTIVWRSSSLSLGTAWGVLTIATLLVFIARRPPRLREIRSFAIPLMFVAAYARPEVSGDRAATRPLRQGAGCSRPFCSCSRSSRSRGAREARRSS